MAENFHNMGKEMAKSRKHRESHKDKPKNTPRHIIIKLTKTKNRDEILKAGRGK